MSKLSRRSVVMEARSGDLAGGACLVVEVRPRSRVDIRSRLPAVRVRSRLLAVEVRGRRLAIEVRSRVVHGRKKSGRDSENS